MVVLTEYLYCHVLHDKHFNPPNVKTNEKIQKALVVESGGGGGVGGGGGGGGKVIKSAFSRGSCDLNV